MKYTLKTAGEVMVIVNEEEQQFPVEVLDTFRLIGDTTRIGIRIWDERWGMWIHNITEIAEGNDVTLFMSNV